MQSRVASFARFGRGALGLEIALLGSVVIRFVVVGIVVAVVVSILALLRGATVRLGRALAQIESRALREIDNGLQGCPGAFVASLRGCTSILAFRIGNVSDGCLLGELRGCPSRARRGWGIARWRGIETSSARGLRLLLVLDRGTPGNDCARAGCPRVFRVQRHGSLMNCVGGLDGRPLHSPLCWVGVAGGDSAAGGDVRQVGGRGDVVWLLVLLFETSELVVRGVM